MSRRVHRSVAALSLVSIWSSESSGSSQSSQKMFKRSGRSYGNATQTITNDPDRFKIYMIVPIVRIEFVRIEFYPSDRGRLKPGFHIIVRVVRIVPDVSKNVQTIGTIMKRYPDDRKRPVRFKIYTIVSIVRIELNSIQAIEVVSVVRVVSDRLGSVSIWSSRSSEHFFETTGTIGTVIWKPGLTQDLGYSGYSKGITDSWSFLNMKILFSSI